MNKTEFIEFMDWAKEQTMNDTIKRTDAINALFQMDGTKIDKAHAIGEIRSIPSINIPQDPHAVTYINALKNRIKELEAKRPQGEWITVDVRVVSIPVYWNEEQKRADEKGAGVSEKCKCSVCGWITSFMGYKKLGVDKPFNYCPHCGTRMKGVNDE